MARGIPGQFGRAVNAPWVWIGLCALFVAPFCAPAPADAARGSRRAAGVLGVVRVLRGRQSGRLGALGVPAAARTCSVACCGSRSGRHGAARSRSRVLAAACSCMLGLVFLVGFRVALNVTNGNVIDVGYASVIGADRLLHGEPLYGGVPARQPARRHLRPARLRRVRSVRPRVPVGRHLGRPAGRPRRGDRVRPRRAWPACGSPAAASAGARSAVLLAYLWAACPFTLLVANSGANDALVARAGARRVPVPRSAGGPRRARRARRADEVRAAGARARCSSATGPGAARSAAAALPQPRPRPAAGRASGPGSSGSGTARSASRPSARRRSPSGASTAGSDAVQAAVTVAAAGLAIGGRVRAAAARRGDGGRAGRGCADRAPAHRHALVLPLPGLVPSAAAGRAARATGVRCAARSTGSIASARGAGPHLISTALIQGSSSDGS